MQITPTRRIEGPTPLTLDECIDIFEERIYGWHLHIAEQLVKPINGENGEILDHTIPHSQYAFLQIIMSYFETIAKYHDGFDQGGSSGEYFCLGIRMCFGDVTIPNGEGVNKILTSLYKRARNPLYHATTAKGIGFSTSPFLIIGLTQGGYEIVMNLESVVTKMIEHLRDYCTLLRNPEEIELREKFMRRFIFDMQDPDPITF